MNPSFNELNNLPNEILVKMLKYLSHYDILYSFYDINERFNSIIKNYFLKNNLTLIINNDSLISFDNKILESVYEIIPMIENNIKCINIDSLIIENIIDRANYPNLKQVTIYTSLQESINIFIDGSLFIKIFGQKIEKLMIKSRRILKPIINTFGEYDILEHREILQDLFKKCSTMFQNLISLQFYLFINNQQLTFDFREVISFSSNITQLYVTVNHFNDCLYILDGSFNQLQKFYIIICGTGDLPSTDHVEIEISNIKCFSIRYKNKILNYDRGLIPLLHRMINLEEFHIHFIKTTLPIIDEHILKVEFIDNIPKLKKFIFNIGSLTYLGNQHYLSSNENIKHSSKKFQNSEMISNIDYFERTRLLYSHIYSHPYTWDFYHHISNNFRGGLFKSVRIISLFDEQPFEHDFFLLIAQSFPYFSRLILRNNEIQKNINCQQIPIKYNNLLNIDLIQSHDNYIEEFLNNNKTCLLNGIYLNISYKSLLRQTNNFTKDEYRTNCSKINYLKLKNDKEDLINENLIKYFHNATIDYYH
ncbi:unnamed protein product [Rotaria sordida]|uniref:F-box domain-containing protein n=1 Tax=Rotaria sordida TaxID=392033 RepID=A0A815Q9E9_9BILA|nr:unnamed protein product [Rotaria sordida]CAF1408547.1 unnamed protein product [Rotaria sordida]CAF1460782.1 unnamed protein product [Rotaria sordida]CAF1465958.1 unnamed protein product [Rotaria sordida]CAF1591175.1 unnamed protein product [Rotaria sordida]